MKNIKRIALFVVFAALILALAACGGNEPSGADNNAGTGQEQTAPAGNGEVVEVTIKATNWEFEPNEITVKKGTKIVLTLENVEGIHAVAIPGFGVNVQAGEPVELIANETGEFPFACSILCGKGHSKMLGKIVVTE